MKQKCQYKSIFLLFFCQITPQKKSPKFFVTICFKYSVTYLSLPKAQTAFTLLSFHNRGEGELISVISACKQQSSINYGWQNHPGRRSQADYSEGWSQQTVMPQYSDLYQSALCAWNRHVYRYTYNMSINIYHSLYLLKHLNLSPYFFEDLFFFYS